VFKANINPITTANTTEINKYFAFLDSCSYSYFDSGYFENAPSLYAPPTDINTTQQIIKPIPIKSLKVIFYFSIK
jgi:hypothetical protein